MKPRNWYILLRTTASDEWNAKQVENELKRVIGDYAAIVAVVPNPEISDKETIHE